MRDNRFQPISLVAAVVLLLMVFALLADREEMTASAAPALPAASTVQPAPAPTAPSAEPPPADPGEIRAPYDDYILTQGPHGESYGHLAIDLTAGKGAAIHAPISGEVSALYTDEYGNPTLVIENDIWQVTLLHGDYLPSPGDQVSIGQVIGYESNHGYTVDWSGRSCRSRDCGYHTHLNIFDKGSGGNANPLEVLNP